MLRGKGLRVLIDEGADGEHWTVVASSKGISTKKERMKTDAEFESLAMAHGGRYDGSGSGV
jgi:hypothetical protein